MRYQEIKLLEEIQLDEINMSPSSLERLAGAIDARAGMEFEMIVPGLGTVDDSDQEPDMDQDERVRYFGQIREFFHDGDFNSRRDVDRLEQELLDAYLDSDFLSEIKSEEWSQAAAEVISELVQRDYEDDFYEQAKEEVLAQTDEFGTNAEELDAAVRERAQELFDAKVDDIMSNMGREYDEAYEEWDENDWQNRIMDWQDEWLEHEGIETMWDVHTNYDISWPYWTSAQDGEMNVQAIADEFSSAIGKPINASTSYHGARRAPGHYVVEPDGSLDPDDSDDTGLEFVSPPLPLSELLSDLDKVKKWADKHGCYTNDSTGLHINVSVPNFSLQSLDYVKLALLLGDKYILDQYGRSTNTYCKSALDKVKGYIKQKPDSAKHLLDQMRGHLADLATKAIHSGSTDKYTSINTKDGYIEFRSPGGDWLNDNFDKIKSSLLRFTVALDAAIDPEKYRNEYLKKLYKLLEPTAVEIKNTDTIKYFADYVAGKTPKAALRSFIKQAQLERKIAKDPTGGQKYWWRVYKEGKNAPNGAEIEVVATTKKEAQDLAAAEWNYANNPARYGWDAEPLRPYDKTPVKATTGEPQPLGQQSGRYTYRAFRIDGNQTLGTFQTDGIHGSTGAMFALRNFLRSIGIDSAQGIGYEEIGRQREPAQQSSDEPQEWEMFNMQTGEVLGTFTAAGYRAAERHIQQTISAEGGDPDQYDARPVRSQSQGSSQGSNLTPRGPGPWELYRLSSNTSYRALVNRDRSQAEREARASLGLRGDDPADFGIRTRQDSPGSTGREFAGWKVLLPSGEEVYRFSGVGNSQADANRIAAEWLRNNGMGVSGEGFEVVPVWREA